MDSDDLHHSLGESYGSFDEGHPHQLTILAHQEDATRPVNTSLINGSVVHGPLGSDADHHNALHKAIDYMAGMNGGASHHFKVYSGVSPKHGELLTQVKVHDTVHFPAWTSTSLKKNVAHGFASGSNHVAVFNIRPGFREGAYIGHVNPHWSEEREFLLKPGTRWRKVGQHSQRQEPVKGSIAPGRLIIYHHFEPAT